MYAIFSSSDISLTACRKPEEPSPMSSTSREETPVHKNLPKGAPILLGKENNHDYSLVSNIRNRGQTALPLYLPSLLPLIESTRRGLLIVERTPRSSVAWLHETSQFSSFRSVKGKSLPEISVKYVIRLLQKIKIPIIIYR